MPTKPCPEVPWSTCFLNISRDGDSTTSLGSLFQCLTTLEQAAQRSGGVIIPGGIQKARRQGTSGHGLVGMVDGWTG